MSQNFKISKPSPKPKRRRNSDRHTHKVIKERSIEVAHFQPKRQPNLTKKKDPLFQCCCGGGTHISPLRGAPERMSPGCSTICSPPVWSFAARFLSLPLSLPLFPTLTRPTSYSNSPRNWGRSAELYSARAHIQHGIKYSRRLGLIAIERDLGFQPAGGPRAHETSRSPSIYIYTRLFSV